MFIYAVIGNLPDVKLTVIKKLEIALLTRTEENSSICCSLMPSEEDTALLFVDSANNVLKRVDAQNASDVHVVYRCKPPACLRAALFVQFAPQQKALLVAERFCNKAA